MKLTIEEIMCVELMKWVRLHTKKYPCLELFHHVFNEGKRDPKKAKAMGILAGVPDYHLPVPNWEYHSLWLELKASDKRPTKEQYTIIKLLRANGNFASWTDNLNDAFLYVEQYVKGVSYEQTKKKGNDK